MSLTLEEITKQDALKDVKIYREITEITFFLGDLAPKIRIRLFKKPNHEEIFFEQSHYIHSPVQGDTCMPSIPYGDDEVHSLQLAINTLIPYYEHSISKGHKPSDKWLVPNNGF